MASENESSSARDAAESVRESRASDSRPSGRGRGRPKSSPEQREKWRLDRARRRAEESGDKGAPEAERAPYVETPEGVAMSAVLGGTIWSLVSRFTAHRDLTAKERTELGRALDPVLYKWLPALNEYAAEAALLMTAWNLWNATAPVPVEPDGVTVTPDAQADDDANLNGGFVRGTVLSERAKLNVSE